MATQKPETTAATTTTQKPEKVKKTPPTVAQRVTEQLKRGALQGKLTEADLDAVAALAGSLKVFLKA